MITTSFRDYLSFKYIFPPRPETVSSPAHLKDLENYIAQPKLNGSCAILATNGHEVIFMNRHKKLFSNKLLITNEDFRSLHRGDGWIYLIGEYLNKSQKDKNRKTFNGKFVIFDILVYENKWMIGSTVKERQELLTSLYPRDEHDGWILKIKESTNCFLVKNFDVNFISTWNEIVKIEMYEGMVLKRQNAKLEVSFNERNNTGWQLKIRKPTKNYQY